MCAGWSSRAASSSSSRKSVNDAPAMANALYDALGVRFNELPLSAEKIYMAIQAQAG